LKAGADGIGEKPGANRTVPSYDAALLHWQRSGEELFKCVIQNQIELCEFFRDRWAQYLKLPEQLSQCRSVTDLGRLQSAFLNEFAHEVMNETEKLAQPVAELARRAVRLAPPHQ
jgi:hypothetical protein